MIAEYIKVGVKYAGRCVCCERPAGEKPKERAQLLLVKAGGKLRVCHPLCAGGRLIKMRDGFQYEGHRDFETDMPF